MWKLLKITCRWVPPLTNTCTSMTCSSGLPVWLSRLNGKTLFQSSMAGAAAASVRLKPLSLPFPSSPSSFPFPFYSNKLLLPLRSSIPSATKTMSSSDPATTKTKTIDSHLHVWATPQQVLETLIQTISSTETETLIRPSFSGCNWVPLLSRPGAHVARRRRFLAQGMWVISIRAPVCLHGMELN